MTEEPRQFEARLAAAGEAWRARRYGGGELPLAAPAAAVPWSRRGWLAASVAAALALAAALPGFDRQPDWPENLRPTVRGPVFPGPPPVTGPVRTLAMPSRPARPSCFSDPESCEQTPG